MSSGRKAALVAMAALALALAAVPRAQAEHTPHHRYFITGTVTNDLGQPVCGLVVRAADITAPKEDGSNDRTATTDASGQFTIQLHEHDGIGDAGPPPGDLNNTIRVSIESVGLSQTVKATPIGGDEEKWGQQTLAFSVPTQTRGSCLSLGETALWGGAVIGGIALIVALVWLVRRPRRVGRGDLRKVPGVGRARARELEGMGIKSVVALAGADPNDISRNSNLTPKQAKALVKRASEIQGTKR